MCLESRWFVARFIPTSQRGFGPIQAKKAFSFVLGGTEGCKIIPTCLKIRGLAPASLSNLPQPAKPAISQKFAEKLAT